MADLTIDAAAAAASRRGRVAKGEGEPRRSRRCERRADAGVGRRRQLAPAPLSRACVVGPLRIRLLCQRPGYGRHAPAPPCADRPHRPSHTKLSEALLRLYEPPPRPTTQSSCGGRAARATAASSRRCRSSAGAGLRVDGDGDRDDARGAAPSPSPATVADDEAAATTIIALPRSSPPLLDALCIIDVATSYCSGTSGSTARPSRRRSSSTAASSPRATSRWCAVDSRSVCRSTGHQRTLPLQWLPSSSSSASGSRSRARACAGRAQRRADAALRRRRQGDQHREAHLLVRDLGARLRLRVLVHRLDSGCRSRRRVDAAVGAAWVLDPSLETGGGADTFQMWVVCFYWAMSASLTIGYGDLTPGDGGEALRLTDDAASSVFYACIFGRVTTLVDSLDQIQGVPAPAPAVHRVRLDLLPLSRSRTTHVHYGGSSRGQVESVLDSLPSGIRATSRCRSSQASWPTSRSSRTPSNFVAAVERFRTELIVGNEYVFTADEPGQCRTSYTPAAST